MTNIDAILLKDPHSASWQLYVNPQAGLAWQDLGFELPPYNQADDPAAAD